MAEVTSQELTQPIHLGLELDLQLAFYLFTNWGPWPANRIPIYDEFAQSSEGPVPYGRCANRMGR